MASVELQRATVGESVLLPAECFQKTRAPSPLLRTSFPNSNAPVAAFRSAPAPGQSTQLWYRDQMTLGHWKRLQTFSQARELVASRDEENPWITITREHAGDADDRGSVVNAFEMLGWEDRVYVCGDTARSGSRWLWSSWPDEAWARAGRVAWIGPSWYRACVFEAQIETVSDALAQLAPALHAVPDVVRQADGFAWRVRSLDYSANQHLRRS